MKKQKTWQQRMAADPQQVTVAKGESKEVNLELKKQK